jgi:hypothetical protein
LFLLMLWWLLGVFGILWLVDAWLQSSIFTRNSACVFSYSLALSVCLPFCKGPLYWIRTYLNDLMSLIISIKTVPSKAKFWCVGGSDINMSFRGGHSSTQKHIVAKSHEVSTLVA